MFSTLESTWDQSARRGWSAAVSFCFQAMALSLLLVVPLFWIQGPPRILLMESLLAPPPSSPPAPPLVRERTAVRLSTSNMIGVHLIQPPRIPPTVADLNETEAPAPPDIRDLGVPGGTGQRGQDGIAKSIGNAVAVIMPKPPVPTHPIKISHWTEANAVYRMQPAYPPLARQARIQGPVVLRAIISRSGTIENLAVVSGHPMLVRAALDAVRQWRYRPYLLNDSPVEIETEITVNFVLSGN